MPRLFAGLEIPHHIAVALSLKRGGLPGARWIDPDNYHVTLSFVGDVPQRTASEIAYALADLEGSDPVEVRIEHLDAFGGDKPRSLFARVRPNDGLMELKGSVDHALYRAGVQTERRKFVPHVTLARLKATSAEAVAHYLEGNSTIEPLHFVAPRLVLFSSKPSLGGGPYAHEQHIGLGVDERAFGTGW